MKILFLESDQIAEYNCSWWRCVSPARALLKSGHEAKVIRIEDWNKQTPEAVELTKKADIIFLQRNLFHECIPTLFYWRTKNKTIIVDIDDSYKDMTEETGSPTYKFWKEGKFTTPDGKEVAVSPVPIKVLEYGVKLTSGLSSPSKLICADWKDYTKTYWFPNYLDLSLYYRQQVYKEPGKIYVGWGGSATHIVSWTKSGAAEAITEIVKKYPQVKILGFGDDRMERYIKVPPSNRAFIGWQPQPTYPAKINLYDIGLIPLYGEYDRRRSWIKAAEYSVMGVPWVGTDSEPTQEINTGVRVKNTPEDWYNALKFYIENLPAMKQAAEKNVEESRARFGIEYHTEELIELFERIIRESKKK